MLRKLTISNLILLAILLASGIINAWGQRFTVIAQTVLSSLQIVAVDPILGADPTDRRAVDINCTTNTNNSDTGFIDQNCQQITFNANYGLNVYGGGTNAKTTFIADGLAANYIASGQRFANTKTVNCSEWVIAFYYEPSGHFCRWRYFWR